MDNTFMQGFIIGLIFGEIAVGLLMVKALGMDAVEKIVKWFDI
jgi:uncharacterized membrane protein